MTSCRLVATSMLSSSHAQMFMDDSPCSHTGARQWIGEYLNKHGGWADVNELNKARSSLSRRDTQCTCEMTKVLRTANCQKHFLFHKDTVSLVSVYKSGLRKMEHLLEEKGPLTMSKLLENLRQLLTEGEQVALGRTRKELKITISKKDAICARDPSTGLVVLSGVHAMIDQACCHSGTIQWIEQYLKEHAGWASIDDMDQEKSEQVLNKSSCQCAIKSLIILPNIRKHFHVKGNTVFARAYYQSGLQKLKNVLQKKGPRKIDELLHMMKEAEVLSEVELRALGDNKKDLAETISKEQQLFQPLSQSGRVHLKAGSLKSCRHHGMIKWMKGYLKGKDDMISIGELITAKSKIPAEDEVHVCTCEISDILLDDKLHFHVQGDLVCLSSFFASTYECSIRKIKVFLQKNGPQPVGILLNMLKQEKLITPREEKVIGRNKKELAYTITKEPRIFKYVSPPGTVMLRNTRHEDRNQVTKAVEYLEKYLRTCKSCNPKTLLREVVRHESLSTGCIAGLNSLKNLLSSYPDRFLIHGNGSISLTKSRKMELSDISHSSKRSETCENASKCKNEITRVGQSAGETAQTKTHSSSTEDVNSSTSKASDIHDRNNNLDAISTDKRKVSADEAFHSESSKDLEKGLRFVEKLLGSHGPMVVQDIHTSIVATSKLDRNARRILGRTPEELLSILLLRKDTFHVIPPSDLVVLCQTTQMSSNQWTTGLKKVEEYLTKGHQLNEVVNFIRENLTAKERQVLGDTKKKVKRTLAHYQNIFVNNSGVISLRYSDEKVLSKGKKKRKRAHHRTPEVTQNQGMEDVGERMDHAIPCKKQKQEAEPKCQTIASPVFVHVVQTAEEWMQACHPLFESASSVVGIDCDDKWFVLRQWDGTVIAAKIQKYLPPASSLSAVTKLSSARSISSDQEVAGPNGKPSSREPEASNKHGDIFHQLSLLLTSSSILKVVYDIQRICAVLSQKMPIRIDNVFDVKVANQLKSRTSQFMPDSASFTELCEMYDMTPSAVVHVSCPTLGEVGAEDVAILKNMAVMTSTLIPHFLHKMFRDMKVDLLTEHNCIVEELCNAWGPGFPSGKCPPKNPNTASVQKQGMSFTSMQIPNPHISDPRVHAKEHSPVCGSGFQPVRHLQNEAKTTSVQDQGMSMTTSNPDLPQCTDPYSSTQKGMSLNSPQMPNYLLPDLHGQVDEPCPACEGYMQPERHLQKDSKESIIPGAEKSLTNLRMPSPHDSLVRHDELHV